jgi:hypothetical protein
MANNSNQQRIIDCMFQRVDKEQRLVAITQELELLSKEIKMQNQEKEQVTSTTLKRLVGRPQKQLHATLMAKNEIKQEDNKEYENSKSAKRRKTLSIYTNRFAPHHWPSIFTVVKKHGDLINALHYLKTFHRKPRKVNGPYEKLSRGFLFEWFTPRRKLKPHLKEVTARGIACIPTHFSILETRPKLNDEIINVLKNMRAVG